MAFRFTGTADRAEDLVQDLLVKLYPKARELAQVDQLRPWLARSLYRLFIDSVRKYARSPVILVEDTKDPDKPGNPGEEAASPEPGPEARLVQSTDQQNLIKAWEYLNPEQRSLLTLHDIEGYTLIELQNMLDCPLGTLKSRLHRARARLRSLLETEPFAAPTRVSNKRT